jgi:Ca-activated chloride channel family protein
MHWVWPIQVLLAAGVLVPALGLLGWRAARRRRQLLTAWLGARPEFWPAALSPRRRLWRAAALAGAWGLVLVALARPQVGTVPGERDLGGVVVLAIDNSASMRAADVSPSRLGLATQWAQDLAAQLPCCRLGLLTFAEEAQVLCPPTEDHAILRELLAAVPAARPAREGSALRPALDLGRRVLDRAGGGVLVVLTDGEYHDLDPGAALRDGQHGVVELVTVTVGGSTPLPVPGRSAGGVVTDPRDGRTALTAARPAAMRELARSSGGLAIAAPSADAAMASAVRFIEERLARGAAPTATVRRAERFQWPLGLALLLLILRLATPAGAPTRPRSATVRSPGAKLALLLVLCLAAHGEDDPGAARLATWRAASLQAPGHDRPRCLYNLALALHQSGQTAAARGAYAEALALPGGALEVRARCLNNLGALAIEEARNHSAHDGTAALEALGRAQAALREALRLDPRLAVARRNLQEAEALADLVQARLATAGSPSAARSPAAESPAAATGAAPPAPGSPSLALPVAGPQEALRERLRPDPPGPDGVALERLCREAGSALEFLQILTRSRAAEGRPATLPW